MWYIGSGLNGRSFRSCHYTSLIYTVWYTIIMKRKKRKMSRASESSIYIYIYIYRETERDKTRRESESEERQVKFPTNGE